MNFGLEDHHILIRDTIHDFATNEIAPQAEEIDASGRFPYEIIEGLAGLGFMGVPFPEKDGGGGADALAYAIVLEELGRVDGSVGITVEAHTSLGTTPIRLFGTEEQKRTWMPELASGRKLAAFGLTEPDAGSDAGGIRTTAVRDGDEWVINGSKCFITNAGTDITAFATATAVTGPGDDGKKEISAITAPKGTPGYTQAPKYNKMGWHGLEKRPPASVLRRIHLDKTHQRQRMTHDHSSLEDCLHKRG